MRLLKMFKMQREFQNQLNNNFDKLSPDKLTEQSTLNVVALIDELMELQRETPWKPWKKQQVYNQQRCQEELVDAFHFFMNLCMIHELTSQGLYNGYLAKHEINIDRQKSNY